MKKCKLFCAIRAALVLAAILPMMAPGDAQAKDPRPNFVIIMVDDMGFSDLGCFGSEIETPRLDALAERGLRFSQFYNTAKCADSRVSLLSGLYSHQAGMQGFTRGATFAEALSRAGYFTAMSGKWHLSEQPTDFGFDRYWGHLSGACNFFKGDDSFRYNGEEWTVPETLNGKPFYTTDAIADFALEFLEEADGSGKPFVLYMAFNAPHFPLQAPEEAVMKYVPLYEKNGWDKLRQERYARQVATGLIDKKFALSPAPDLVRAWDSLNADQKRFEAMQMATYAAMVDIVDRNVGRVVDDLTERGLLDNTLLMFFSDNGASPFGKQEVAVERSNSNPWDRDKRGTSYGPWWANLCNTPFRHYKQNQHEGGIASSMVVHWPDGLKTEDDAITHQTGHLIDIMPTLLDLADADYPVAIGERVMDPLQGRSLLPIFQGKECQSHTDLFFNYSSNRALRQGDWKLVSEKFGRWELYDLAKDRTELDDLHQAYSERAETMEARWFEMAREVSRLKGAALTPVGEELSPRVYIRGLGKKSSSKERKEKEKTGQQ